jgi:alpha-L-fucosidase
MNTRTSFAAIGLVLFGLHMPEALPQSQTSSALQARPEAVQWFEGARFGMFIHWGVYSVPGRGEWVMENEKIPVSEYEKFAPQFNPQAFDAKKIVQLAKRAGMRYITVTSKHHDGFAMWPSKQTTWDIADATRYGQDLLQALAEESRRAGLRLFFYYSQLDWHHPDYWPLGSRGHSAGRAPGGSFPRYLDFMDAQLTELLTQYGPIGGIWFDGMWDKPDADWRLERTYNLIHKLQPSALIGSNHHRTPYPGEDFQMFEKDLPGANSAGFNTTVISALPRESCDTLNDSWGYNKLDNHYKSTKQLIHFLVRSAGADANFLLNIGPTGSGEVPAEFEQRLTQMGEWLDKYGETIYGTRGGPVTARSWGVTTQRDGRIYAHILDWTDRYLILPPLAGIKSARMFDTAQAVPLRKLDQGLLLELPASPAADSVDRIVILEQ